MDVRGDQGQANDGGAEGEPEGLVPKNEVISRNPPDGCGSTPMAASNGFGLAEASQRLIGPESGRRARPDPGMRATAGSAE